MKKIVAMIIVGAFLFSTFILSAWAIGKGMMGADSAAMSGIQSQYVTLSNPGKDVFVKDRSGQWVPAEDGMVILPGDEVRTGEGSSVEIILDNGEVGHITIKEGSLFSVMQAERNPSSGATRTLLDLAVGKIMVKAQALKGNSKFEVQTPTSITGVRGTLFEIEVEGTLDSI